MDLKESYFDTGEVRLHVMEGPDSGPPLVLLHGIMGNWTAWAELIPQLAARWHVYALDLRGHGLSGRPAALEGYHLSHHVHDTLAFLRGGVRQPALLLGHSYGAVISLLSAGPAAEWLRGIVAEDPPLMLRRDSKDSDAYQAYFAWVYQMRQTANTLEEVLAEVSKQNPTAPVDALRPWAQSLTWLDPNLLLAVTAGNQRETARDIDFAAHFRAIACPVLMLQADQDRGAALKTVDLDFLMANAPQARFLTFPGSGHGIHDEQPAAFLKAVEDFGASLA
jgi:pimeloyl-ACP methyl ester carboxylesterase